VLDPHLYIGGYFIYGFITDVGNASSTCTDPANTCSANQFRFGATAQWHFRPERALDPWAGAGLGYEVLNLSATDSTGANVSSASLYGFELALQGGLDVKPKSFFGFGPFVEFALAHYFPKLSEDPSFAVHAWILVGLRLRTGL
jgi:hypothetical protein